LGSGPFVQKSHTLTVHAGSHGHSALDDSSLRYVTDYEIKSGESSVSGESEKCGESGESSELAVSN